MAKKRMVATKLMKVEVTATGSGTPYRLSVYIVVGPGSGVERGDVTGPRSHASRQDRSLERRVGIDVAGNNPEPKASADPVERGEGQPGEHPDPLDPADTG